MNIDKLNNVHKYAAASASTKYTKPDEKETVSERDTLTLTEEAQKLLTREKEAKSEKYQSTGFMELDMLKRQLDRSNEKECKVVNMSKCFKIAARISNGDKVPLKDMKYLRENAPELFKNALMFKKYNPEPKKYKTCLDKDDEEYMRQRQENMFGVSVGADDAIILNLEA